MRRKIQEERGPREEEDQGRKKIREEEDQERKKIMEEDYHIRKIITVVIETETKTRWEEDF